MSGAQEYYDGLLTQGYTPDQAKMYTQQHFPGFEPAAPQVAPMDQFQVDQTQVQDVAQQHGVDPTQLAETARHFDANQDGVLQQSELQATAQQMVSTTAPVAPAAAAPPAAAPMAAAPPAAAPMGGMPAPGMAAPAAAPMGGMPAPGMAAPMGGMPAPGMAAPMGGMMPAPAAAGGGPGVLNWVALGLTVAAITLIFIAMFSNSWMTGSEDDSEIGYGLSGAEAKLGSLEISLDFSDSDCDDDPDCKDARSAGSIGSIILWIAVVAAIGSLVLLVLNNFGVYESNFGMIAAFVAGGLAITGAIVWMIMFPEIDDGPDNWGLGLAFYLAITGGILGAGAGTCEVMS